MRRVNAYPNQIGRIDRQLLTYSSTISRIAKINFFGLDGYELQRRTEFGSYVTVAYINNDQVTFVDTTGFNLEDYYYYRIKRIIGENESDWSSEIEVQFGSFTLQQSGDSIILNWNL